MVAKPTRRAPIANEPMSFGDEGALIVASIEVTKIVREHVPIRAGGEGMTFGAMLDASLEEVAMRGEEVTSIKFDINPETWTEFARSVRNAEAVAYDREGPR